jgi:glucan phosphoethanolaminetransferase (alkaline phosphatase superfamily)
MIFYCVEFDMQINLNRKTVLIFAIFLMITGILFLELRLLHRTFFKTVSHLNFSFDLSVVIAYVVSLLCALTTIISVAFLRSRVYFVFFSVFIASLYLLDLSYQYVNGVGFSGRDLEIINNGGSAYALEAISLYLPAIFKALIGTTFIAGILFCTRWFVRDFTTHRLRFLLGAAALSIASGLYVSKTTGGTTFKYPIATRFPVMYLYAKLDDTYYGPRDQLTISPTLQAKYTKIILIIDESINADYLSINGYHRLTTPFLGSLKERLINLGVASSATNCSDMSNLLLYSGARLSDLPDKEYTVFKKPSVFQYGKAAGYKTSYISGQGIGLTLQNGLGTGDLEYIDYFYQPSKSGATMDVPERDILEQLTDIINGSNKKEFVYIVKRGAHFQWENQYPESQRVFAPILEKSDLYVKSNKEKALNSYANAIRWSADGFFRELFDRVKQDAWNNVLIIYTSDHGQSILTPGTTRSTHCTEYNPPPSQGRVPIMLMGDTDKLEPLLGNIESNYYSHYQIFPTILLSMGFEGDLTDGNLTESSTAENQKFYSGNLFGKSRFSKTRITDN